jgi:hypothetical protein
LEITTSWSLWKETRRWRDGESVPRAAGCQGRRLQFTLNFPTCDPFHPRVLPLSCDFLEALNDVSKAPVVRRRKTAPLGGCFRRPFHCTPTREHRRFKLFFMVLRLALMIFKALYSVHAGCFLTLPYKHSRCLPSLRSDITSDKGFPFIVY